MLGVNSQRACRLTTTFTETGSTAMMLRAALCAALFAGVPAHAQQPNDLVGLINAYRAAPGSCEGWRIGPKAPLAPHPALDNVQVDSGAFLEQALERAGYPVAQAEAIYISGPPDARAVMAAIARKYCRTLLSTHFSAVGAGRTGDSWLIVFAQPAQPSQILKLPVSAAAGKVILDAVNAARATPRSCGEQDFPAAPAISWNDALGEAALAHSRDMAKQRYFSHQGKDGRAVAERALQAGYRWRRIGENIAAGQESPDEVVAGWLSSPGHCANIMHRDFREMGAGYAINSARETPRVYWTQVFGTLR